MKIRQLLASHSLLVRYFRLRKAQRRVLASQGQALDRWSAPTDPPKHTEPLKMQRELKGERRRQW
jgi:hypothetical protein